jgi:hypothetical protein
MAKSALRPTFGLPKVPAAVCTSLGLAGRPEKREYSRQIGSHPGKMLGWRISGRLERAKTLLASMVNGDLAAVNAIIAAPQLIVDGLHKMRQLAADPALRSSITTDAAVDECLFAPTTVVRQAKTSGEVGGRPFRRGSLFILGLGSASKGAANRDLVFLSQSWSRCPAEKWVPALLEGVWTRVSATLHEVVDHLAIGGKP